MAEFYFFVTTIKTFIMQTFGKLQNLSVKKETFCNYLVLSISFNFKFTPEDMFVMLIK